MASPTCTAIEYIRTSLGETFSFFLFFFFFAIKIRFEINAVFPYRICTLDQVGLSTESKILLSGEYLVYKFTVKHSDFRLVFS